MLKRLFWFCVYGLRRARHPRQLKGLLSLRSAAFKVDWFAPNTVPETFPPVDQSLAEPAGLLAVGGRVTDDSLRAALHAGIYPGNQPHQPVQWWSPALRMVLFPDALHIEKNVKRLIRNDRYRITFDTAFRAVVEACAQPREGYPVSWIVPLIGVYDELHRQGNAFSVEVWDREDNLVGGLFGLVCGQLVTIESRFTITRDTSKIAVVYLCAHLRRWGYPLIDVQEPSADLERLGCGLIPRDHYLGLMARAKATPGQPRPWRIEVKPDDDGAPRTLEAIRKSAGRQSSAREDVRIQASPAVNATN